MNESEKNQKETQEPIQFSWTSTGEKGSQGLQEGLAAFGKMLEGIVKLAGGVGADTIRNGIAANWLDGVATSLENATLTARETGKSPTGKCGEVACFLERVEAEVKGTKYEVQTPGFRKRLEEANQLLERMHSPTHATAFADDVRKLGDIAGYFRGAAGPKQSQSDAAGGA